MIIFATYFWSI